MGISVKSPRIFSQQVWTGSSIRIMRYSSFKIDDQRDRDWNRHAPGGDPTRGKSLKKYMYCLLRKYQGISAPKDMNSMIQLCLKKIWSLSKDLNEQRTHGHWYGDRLLARGYYQDAEEYSRSLLQTVTPMKSNACMVLNTFLCIIQMHLWLRNLWKK